jgi:hypothetical protein
MMLKAAFGACLILAHPRFLQNKGLMLSILSSLAANIIIGFLHAMVPVPLVSITDAIATITLLGAGRFVGRSPAGRVDRCHCEGVHVIYCTCNHTGVPGATRTPASGDCQKT